MSKRFCMQEKDLLELYQLATLYKRTYSEDMQQCLEAFPEMIEKRYKESTHGKDLKQQSNPRRAGRKPKYTAKQNDRITDLYQTGLSLRCIARESGCSVGHVQDVLQHKGAK